MSKNQIDLAVLETYKSLPDKHNLPLPLKLIDELKVQLSFNCP